jgi:hypothetical protein
MLQSKVQKIVESCALGLFETYRRDKTKIKSIFISLEKLKKILMDHSVQEVFCSPLFSDEEKLVIVQALKLSSEITRFLKILIALKHIQHIVAIIAAYETLFLAEVGHLKATVTLAKKELIASASIKSLKGKLEKIFDKKVKIIYKIDTNIYGGFTLMVGSFYMDASIKSQLDQLQRHGIGA